MTLGREVNGSALSAHAERSAFLGKVDPETRKDAGAFAEAEAHAGLVFWSIAQRNENIPIKIENFRRHLIEDALA